MCSCTSGLAWRPAPMRRIPVVETEATAAARAAQAVSVARGAWQHQFPRKGRSASWSRPQLRCSRRRRRKNSTCRTSWDTAPGERCAGCSRTSTPNSWHPPVLQCSRPPSPTWASRPMLTTRPTGDTGRQWRCMLRRRIARMLQPTSTAPTKTTTAAAARAAAEAAAGTRCSKAARAVRRRRSPRTGICGSWGCTRPSCSRRRRMSRQCQYRSWRSLPAASCTDDMKYQGARESNRPCS